MHYACLYSTAIVIRVRVHKLATCNLGQRRVSTKLNSVCRIPALDFTMSHSPNSDNVVLDTQDRSVCYSEHIIGQSNMVAVYLFVNFILGIYMSSSRVDGITMDDISSVITAEELVYVLYDYLDLIQSEAEADSPLDALKYVSDSVRSVIELDAHISCGKIPIIIESDKDGLNVQTVGSDYDPFKIEDFIKNKAEILLIDRLIENGDITINENGQFVVGE